MIVEWFMHFYFVKTRVHLRHCFVYCTKMHLTLQNLTALLRIAQLNVEKPFSLYCVNGCLIQRLAARDQ